MRRLRSNLREWRDGALNRSRMLLAAKTAVAAAIAWAIVPLLPFVDNKYSYVTQGPPGMWKRGVNPRPRRRPGR